MLRIRIRNVADRICYPQQCNYFGTSDMHYMLRMLRIWRAAEGAVRTIPPRPWGGFVRRRRRWHPSTAQLPPYRGNCDRYDPVADRAALHVVADPRAAKQDLRRT